MAPKTPNLTDLHVASRVRLRRLHLGMSQEGLAQALGITFQQVQKYEKGANRISAGRLQQIATVLTVPLQFFYDGGPESVEEGPRQESRLFAEILDSPGTIRFLQALARKENPKLRRAVENLAAVFAEEAEAGLGSQDLKRRSG